jgi:ATP-dependent DNA ligase
VLFGDVVATSAAVTATSARSAKTAALADLLGRLAPDEVRPAVGFLTGLPRQGRIGVGWATLGGVDVTAAAEPSVEIAEVDAVIDDLALATGPGSVGQKRDLLTALYGRMTEDERWFFVRLLGGELRQGALVGVMVDAVAKAAGVPATAVRRAHMLGGRLDDTAVVALAGGAEALAAIGLQVGRAVQPMLASTAPDVATAVEALGTSSVEWKLDGLRIQVHRSGDRVAVFTRNLNVITDRVPEIVRVAAELPVDRVVLDGEAIAMAGDGRPRLFQETVAWRDRQVVSEAPAAVDDPALAPTAGGPDAPSDAEAAADPDLAGLAVDPAGLRPFFFDCLHLDGRDLVDAPLTERLRALDEASGPWRIPGEVTDDPAAGQAVLDAALAAGHEGVVVKAIDSPYQAGRRGKTWQKVKPVHTLDLVVLAAEWGHGRRTGWLSNLHLGARDPEGAGFVMVGKTFKGLTDELLRWQTERFQQLEERTEGHIVWVRPEQVVEIALDGVQSSTRYPGKVALRFARVLRYRPDKAPEDADTITTVQAMLPRS